MLVEQALRDLAAALGARARAPGRCGSSLGIASTPARAKASRSAATLRASAARSAPEARRWRTLASEAAAIAGGSEVVKMKPLAWLRTLSITLAGPAMKPPSVP